MGISKDTPHFIASQMILPKATGTVVSYSQILLQRAASADPSKTSVPPATTLPVLPHQAQARSFMFVLGPSHDGSDMRAA